ncbi:alpha-L-fucosidase [Actinopolymorpha alba]|uniref:alpha-L-fucosidase n=1 Tax=Actinopolymorpha alba TaxID=533267 RepID=UPI0003604E20|nr:alpha-L-fucosidase [Actinopolymorpha alba]
MTLPAATETPYIPKRHVHLDFHTGPHVPDVGRDFDPVTFAKTFQEAGVDSVTVFGKCHHGHLYFDTDHPARHPGLSPDLDLLGEQINALRAVGIKAPIYLSVQCDEYAADTHPEWIALHPDLRQVKRSDSALEPGWQILDMSSPYQDYLADQLDQVLRRYAPVDGIFLDMCWDQPSASQWALRGMRTRGFDPQDELDRARYARLVAREYMTRYRDMIRAAQGRSQPASIFFNSRPRILVGDEGHLVTHQEVEALPTGGWGYSYTPYIARFVRAHGQPVFGMTGRFHKSWGDNAALKPAAALKYECCQLLSLGMGVSTGDLLHPRGATNQTTYQLIGDVYRHLAACEPFTDGTRVVSEVALLVNPDRRPGHTPHREIDDSAVGAIRTLQQCRQQFDVVSPQMDLTAYRVVIVPESTVVDEELRGRLATYVDGGGGLVLVGSSAVGADGEPLLPEQAITVEGDSPYTHTCVRLGDKLRGCTPDFDTVVYERGLRIKPAGADVLAHVVEPYFERTWEHFSGHSYTPPDRVSDYAAITQNGSVVTIALPWFEAFGRHANVPYREIFGAVLARLLPDPLLRAGGPTHLETSVQEGRDGTTVVHLLSYLPSRQGTLDLVTDPFPLVDVPVAVRRDAAPTSVTLQPDGTPLDHAYRDGYVHTRVTVLDGHALLVIT